MRLACGRTSTGPGHRPHRQQRRPHHRYRQGELAEVRPTFLREVVDHRRLRCRDLRTTICIIRCRRHIRATRAATTSTSTSIRTQITPLSLSKMLKEVLVILWGPTIVQICPVRQARLPVNTVEVLRTNLEEELKRKVKIKIKEKKKTITILDGRKTNVVFLCKKIHSCC
jgi:hypothetical protein